MNAIRLDSASSSGNRYSTRGVRPGDRVGIDLPRGPELLPAHIATLASGATVVPINPALTAAERARVLERAELKTLLEPTAQSGRPGRPGLAQSPADSPALLIFTSGTTGVPKGVPLGEAQLEANLDALARAWGLSQADRLLHVLPCHHLHGSRRRRPEQRYHRVRPLLQ